MIITDLTKIADNQGNFLLISALYMLVGEFVCNL